MNDSTHDTLTGRPAQTSDPSAGTSGTGIGVSRNEPSAGLDASMPGVATMGSGSSTAAALDPRMRRLAEGAHGAIDRAVERMTPSIDRVGRRVDRARVQADAMTMRTREHVRERPMSSLLVAFMAGLVIGSLASR